MSRWTVADVMTVDAVSVQKDTPFKGIVDLMEAHGVNAVPVTDSHDRVVGIVSTADLLPKIEFAGGGDGVRVFENKQVRQSREKARATAAAELMSAPAITVTPPTPLVVAARLMHAHDLKRMPVVNDAGRLVGIVTRQDLVKVFLRSDDEIKREILASLDDGIVGVEPSQLRVEVDDGVVTLLGELDRRSLVTAITRQFERVDGVVDVVSHLSYQHDDTGESRTVRRPSAFMP